VLIIICEKNAETVQFLYNFVLFLLPYHQCYYSWHSEICRSESAYMFAESNLLRIMQIHDAVALLRLLINNLFGSISKFYDPVLQTRCNTQSLCHCEWFEQCYSKFM